MIQTSEGNLPQGLDAAIRTGLERGRRTVARRARFSSNSFLLPKAM